MARAAERRAKRADPARAGDMCGIAGWIGERQDWPGPKVLRPMMDAIAHRGPDGAGEFLADTRDGHYRVVLGHRRLAIIDLAAGQQPMQIGGGVVTVVFNGGDGHDVLSGGSGQDVFDFDSIMEAGDKIRDFAAGEGGDVLDLRDLLPDYDGDSVIDEFLVLEQSNSNVSVNVDPAGTSDFVLLATLEGVRLEDITDANVLV